MQVVLVIADSRGKNLVFVTDTLKAYGFDDAIRRTKKGELKSIHVVKSGQGLHLRSNPNQAAGDNLDTLSVSASKLFAVSDDSGFITSLPGFKRYWNYYVHLLEKLERLGEEIIVVDRIPRATKERIRAKLRPHRTLVQDAAEHFSIDPNTLGAIIIDEIARMIPFESIAEVTLTHTISYNASVGIAQVKLETARGIIRKGYYNPNPKDKKLSKGQISKVSRSYLYGYVVQPKHNVNFSAARIREIIDQWLPVIDISNQPEIIGTLYNQSPRKPNPTPKPTSRGLQIKEEFYPLAQSILSQ